MNKYLTGILILISFVLLSESCNTLRHQGFRKDSGINPSFKPVFGHNFEKVLYGTEIVFGKKTFSGLIIIKQIPEQKSFRLAFVTEAGMRIFEMEFFKDGGSRVHYISDFLNKKAVVNKLLSDFALLFPVGNKETIRQAYSNKADTGTYILRINEKVKKDYYFAAPSDGPEKISEKGCVYGRTSVFLKQYESTFPAEILFTHKLLKLNISLKQIPYPKWN
jgi:hypothetical protein